MAQRIVQLMRLFYGIESTEGTEVLGTASEAFFVNGEPSRRKPRSLHQRKMGGEMGHQTGVAGGQDNAGLAFAAELRNSGGSSNQPDIRELLKTCFGTETVDTASTTINDATPTASAFDVTSASNLTAGNGILVETATTDEFEMGWIKSISGSTVTLEQALTFTPADGAKIRGTTTYLPANTGHQSLSIQEYFEPSANNYTGWVGCKGTVNMEFPQASAIPMAQFDFSGWSWKHDTNSQPSYTIGDTDGSGSPPVTVGGNFKIDGTQEDVLSANYDLANELGRKLSQNSTEGTAAIFVVDRNPAFQVTLYNTDQSKWDDADAETERAIEHSLGNTENDMVGVFVPNAQFTVEHGSQNGLLTDVLSGQCNFDSTGSLRLAIG